MVSIHISFLLKKDSRYLKKLKILTFLLIFFFIIFQPPPRPELIDHKVIDGHIIPNRVLFTSPVALQEPFPTLAFEDNLKVTISFFTQSDGRSTKSMF